MNKGKLARLLRFFGTGVVDQVLLSAASFAAGFVMIRFTSDADYGQFVLAQSAVLLMLSAQGAWLSGPIIAIAPRKSTDTKRLMIGAMQVSQTRFLWRVTLTLLIVLTVGYAAGLWSGRASIVGATTVMAAWAALQRDYLRSVLLIYSRPQSVLHADLAYVAVLMIGIAFAVFLRNGAGIYAIVALAAAFWVGAGVAYRMLASNPGWTSDDSTPFWKEIRPLGLWATTGAVIYWLFAQSYNYILATRLDLTAVANVNAARLVLMPVFVFTLGINNLLMPVAANWFAELELSRMLRRLGLLTLAIATLDVVYFSVGWKVRGWLVGDLLHKSIADRDRLLILWAGIALIFLFREVLQAALFALRQLKSMAWLMGLSAALALSLMWVGIPRWGAASVLIGQVAGECVNLLGLAWLLWSRAQLKHSAL